MPERGGGIPDDDCATILVSSLSSSENVENSSSVMKEELGLPRRLARAPTLPSVMDGGVCMSLRPSSARKTLCKSLTAKTVVGE